MLVRSPKLFKEQSSVCGSHFGNFQNSQDSFFKDWNDCWVCYDIANRVWNLDEFEQIRVVVSDKSIPQAVRIVDVRIVDNPWDSEFWSNAWEEVTGLRVNSIMLWTSLSEWLQESFPKGTDTLWVWIEEA